MQSFDTFRIGNDPELRYTPGNDSQAVINLSLASNYGRKDPNTGKRPVQWVDATLWGKQAENVAQYLFKGSEVTVTLDDVHIEEFQRNGGGTGSKLVGRISTLKLVGGAPQQGQQQAQQQQRPQQQAQQQQRPQQQAQQSQQGAYGPAPDDFSEDIPFRQFASLNGV